ncbi:hypothetical protein BHM03_00028736 [Ensete ventricosum]|nr:hypothetical protein BHM03_00028736 [Ensete ventricosum]
MRIARYRVVPPKWPSVDFSCQRSIDGEKAKKKKKKRKRRKKTSFPRAGRKIEATCLSRLSGGLSFPGISYSSLVPFTCYSATSVDVEEHLYRLANDMGITVITSSQRPALIPFHAMELKLIDGEGKWELCAINQ